MTTDSISQQIKAAGEAELQRICELAAAELEDRRRKRRDEAMAEIRRIAGAEHIAVNFGAKPKARRNGNAPVYRSGHSYQHPSDKAKTWNAKGQKPNWVRELEAEGRRAVEIANDNIPPSLKKTG